MVIDVLKWRGKFLSSGKDRNNKKFISMSGNKSELYIPIQIEENTSYRIKMELRKESGNGLIHCDIFGNKNFTFEDIVVKCDSSSWENFEFFVTTKTFPKTLSFYFRILREGGVGAINVADISVEKIKYIQEIKQENIIVKEQKIKENIIQEKLILPISVKEDLGFLKNEFIEVFENKKTNKIKVLYLPLTSPEIKQSATKRAFVDCGVNLCSFDFHSSSKKINILETNNLFFKLANWFKPDFIHMQLQYSGIIYPETLKKIKNSLPNVCISNWTGDIRNHVEKYFVDISKEIDLSLISSTGQLELFKSNGCKNVDYWQIGYDDQKFFRMSDDDRDKLHKKHGNDIVFCCNHFRSSNFPGTEIRQNIISVFQENFKEKFTLYGGGQKNSKGTIKFFEQNEIYNSAKIVISINHFNDVENYFSDRQLVAMASGTLTLCHYVPGLENYFENKKDLVWFHNEQEALELAKYYLEHPEEAEEIGKSGAEKVLQEHTYFSRVKELLEKVNIQKPIDISVVMGTYNRLLCLQDVIGKILNSYGEKNIEIIINDAGSTDGTIEWLKEQIKNDDRIKVIFSGKRTNIVEAYNECFKIAKGKYVTWFSDDVFPVVNAIEEMCNLMDTLDEKDMGAFLLKQEGRGFYVPWLFGFPSPVVSCVYTETLKKYNYWNSDYPYYACDNEIDARFLRMGGKIVESSAKLIHSKIDDNLRKTNSKEFENFGSSDKFYLVSYRYGEPMEELYPMVCFIIKEKVPNYVIQEQYDDLKYQYNNSKFYIMYCNGVEINDNLQDFVFLENNSTKKFDLVIEINKNENNISFPNKYVGNEKLKNISKFRKNKLLNENKYIKFFSENKEGTKVLYLGLSGSSPGRVEGVETAFVNNGINLCSFDFNKCFKGKGKETDNIFKLLVDEFLPEFIHMQLQNTNTISSKTIRHIKEKHPNIIFSNWSGDVSKDVNNYFLEISKEIDLTLICNVGKIEEHLEKGCKNVQYLQCWADPNVFYKMNKEKKKEMYNIYKNDIVFIAHNYINLDYSGGNIRRNIVEKIFEHYGDKFGLYGNGWGNKGKGSVTYLKQNEIYNGAKILLSINHFNDIELYFSNRQLITMATGVLTLSHYIPGLEKYFENKKDLVWFKNEQEALELIKYYLDNPEEAEEIGENGRQKILKNHTINCRILELMEKSRMLQNKNY